MSRNHALLVLVSLSTLALGCEPSLESVTITPYTNPPLPVVVTGTRIEIPDGIAVAVDVVGTNDEGDAETDIDTPSASTSAFGVVNTAVKGRFIFYGNEPASGQVKFTALGTEGEVNVPFTVTAQE
jgi:hypothetical protein